MRCGSAGTYSILQLELAMELRAYPVTWHPATAIYVSA